MVTTATQNFPINFIPNVPIYLNGSMQMIWVLFFQELWNRTGGNTSNTTNITDLITNQSSSGDVSQQVNDLLSRVSLLEANDAWNVAVQAIESQKNVTTTAKDPMAYISLAVC